MMQVLGTTAQSETHWLAQQLHDTVLQTLAIARIRIDKALTDTGPLPRDLGEDLRRMLDREIATLRELVRGSGRPAPPQPDLCSALAAVAEHLESVTGIAVRIDDRTATRRSWTHDDLVAHRILREALHNAAKHSGAEHIRVTLVDREERLVCEVCDDGHGFDPASTPKGFGMTAMHAQARDAGGELEIDSRRSGTRLTLVLPRQDRAVASDGTTSEDPTAEGNTSDDSARPCAKTDDRHLRRPSGRTVRDPHPSRGRPLPDRR
jgi:signal transduction histidine kinase